MANAATVRMAQARGWAGGSGCVLTVWNDLIASIAILVHNSRSSVLPFKDSFSRIPRAAGFLSDC